MLCLPSSTGRPAGAGEGKGAGGEENSEAYHASTALPGLPEFQPAQPMGNPRAHHSVSTFPNVDG